MQKRLIAALAALPGAAAALTLGDAQLRSHLGEPLDVRIPVTRAAGEDLSGSCFAIAPAAVEGVAGAGPADLAVALRRASGRAELHVTTTSPIEEPAVAVTVRISCPRGAAATDRIYVLLPVPPVRVTLPTVPAAQATAAEPLQGTVPFTAREGDTLASLARAFAGPSAKARRDWLAGVRAANPQLASQADDAPLAASTPLGLPTPRARLPAVAAAPAAEPSPAPLAPVARVEAPARPPRPAKAAALPADVSPPPAPARAAPPAPVAAAPAAPRTTGGGGFVLRLSAPEVDLTPTQRFDDRMRQQLRERQLVLDQDDQVAALLQMRHSLKQLESRVAELQLRLSTTPTLTERTPAPTPAPAAVVPAAPVAAPAPAPAPTAVTTPAPAAATPATPAPAPAAEAPVRKKSAVQPRPAAEATPWWMWAAAALGLLLLAALVLRMLRRRRADAPLAIEDTAPHEGPATDAPLRDHDGEALEAPAAARAAVASDAMLTTRLPENSNALRRRYIEERFPEVLNGTIVLGDADSVIKGARLFYEDGALPRAVELLHFAIEDNPAHVRTWLALFEIYRLERLTGEYAELAQRFREAHGNTDEWRKVRYFGREIDPGNALYREDVVNSLETIGPREGRKLAANLAHVDPIAENWLNAPMDFENEVLANELRNALMASASLKEQDLIPNPMPALRHVEMFTVA